MNFSQVDSSVSHCTKWKWAKPYLRLVGRQSTLLQNCFKIDFWEFDIEIYKNASAGTLTPIVKDPDCAFMSTEVRLILLSSVFPCIYLSSYVLTLHTYHTNLLLFIWQIHYHCEMFNIISVVHELFVWYEDLQNQQARIFTPYTLSSNSEKVKLKWKKTRHEEFRSNDYSNYKEWCKFSESGVTII